MRKTGLAASLFALAVTISSLLSGRDRISGLAPIPVSDVSGKSVERSVFLISARPTPPNPSRLRAPGARIASGPSSARNETRESSSVESATSHLNSSLGVLTVAKHNLAAS